MANEFVTIKEFDKAISDAYDKALADYPHAWEGKYDPKLASEKHIKNKGLGANSL